jgi:hypothetical protein
MKNLTGLLKSKTFWFNAVTGALSIVDIMNGNAISPEVKALIIAVGNVALRFLTTKPLSEK